MPCIETVGGAMPLNRMLRVDAQEQAEKVSP